MKTDGIEKLKTLKRFAQSARDYWPSFNETTADTRCDKYNAGFSVKDTRFCVFKAPQDLSFCAYTGYYGNSSCSTFGGGISQDMIDKYLARALDKCGSKIFEAMAEMAEEDAAKIVADAEKELRQISQLIESARQPA